MGSGSSAKSRRAKAIISVLAVALIVTASFVLLTDSNGNSSATAVDPQINPIIYRINGGTPTGGDYTGLSNVDGWCFTIQYNGIPSSEYNPEFWAGTGHVPVGVVNWIGPNADDQLFEVYITVSNVPQGGTTLDAPTGFRFTDSDGNNATTSLTINYGDTQVHTYVKYLSSSAEIKKVFGGWSDGSTDYYPGDVIPNGFVVAGQGDESKTKYVYDGGKYRVAGDGDGEKIKYIYNSVEELSAVWINPDIFIQTTIDFDGAASHTLGCEPYGELKTTTRSLNITDPNLGNHSYAVLLTDNNGVPELDGYTDFYADGRNSASIYGTIYKFGPKESCQNWERVVFFTTGSTTTELPKGTYRSNDINNTAILSLRNADTANTVVTSGDVIIDNVGLFLDGKHAGKDGASGGSSIYGSGNVLIMGTNITNDTLSIGSKKNLTANTKSVSNIIQLFGGNESTAIASDPLRTIPMPSGNGTLVEAKVATCLIVHSGIYYNIFAGNHGGNIGVDNSNGYRSTYMVLRGGMVTNSATGGSFNGKIFGGPDNSAVDSPDAYGGPEPAQGKTTTKVNGTFAYLLGNFFSTADDYEDGQTEDLTGTRATFLTKISSMVTGGNNRGTVRGSTHLFLSGNASVWDIHGASREINYASFTANAYTEISGNARVRHMVAGTVANAVDPVDASGCDSSTTTNNVLYSAEVHVLGNAKVASVYGAGYDIWRDGQGKAMTKGLLDVDIYGGTVGNVYGGGYRGSIGRSFSGTIQDGKTMDKFTPEELKALTVQVFVRVKGGEVLGDVYGGGCGGLDLAKHEAGGGKYLSPSSSSNGKSCIYGYVTVEVSGEDTVVNGDVYGGGKSVPIMDNYKGIFAVDYFNNIAAQNYEYSDHKDWKNYVASVVGHVEVNINGGTIGGSVFGGGRGIEMTKSNDVWTVVGDYSKIISMKADGTLHEMDWYSGNGAVTYKCGDDYHDIYLKYARVTSDMSRSGDCKSNATRVNVTGTAYVTGGVFGGGNNGCAEGGRVVNIVCSDTAEDKDYNINNSVYGGSSTGNDEEHSIVIITSGSVRGSVFGGGFMGETNGTTNVSVGYVIDEETETTNYQESVNPKPTVYIGDSVYAGADVKQDSGFPYSQALVLKDGNVYIYGKNTDITIGGSIMGDGNSCLTAGTKRILIEYYVSNSTLTGIHRANSVTLVSSNLKISGREARVYDKIPVTLYYDSEGSNPVSPGDDISGCNTIYYATSAAPSTILELDLSEVSLFWYNEKGYEIDADDSCAMDYVPINDFSDLAAKVLLRKEIVVADTTGSNQLIKMASLFRIGSLVLKNGSSVSIQNPVEDVRSYSSQDMNGSATTNISPMNSIEFTSGGSFYVRKEMSSVVSGYGDITGYTQIILSNQGSYGAYLFGKSSSTGGFVISKNGQYSFTDVTEFDGVKTWYVAGVEHKMITMNLPSAGQDVTNTVTSNLGITKLQGDTRIYYKSGEYFQSHAGYTFVSPGGSYSANDPPLPYSLSFGHHTASTVYNIDDEEINAETVLTINDMVAYHYKNGAYVPITESTIDPKLPVYFGNNHVAAIICDKDNDIYSVCDDYSWANVKSKKALVLDDDYLVNADNIDGCLYMGGPSNEMMYEYAPGSGIFNLNFKFTGKPTESMDYIGYVIITMEERGVIEYGGNQTQTVVINTVEIRVDLYIEGYSDGDVSYDVGMDAIYDDDSEHYQGSSDILVQQPQNTRTLYVTSVTAKSGNETLNDAPALVISGVGNLNNTNGWMEAYSRIISLGQGQKVSIGVLSGSHNATLRVAIDAADTPANLKYIVVCEIRENADANAEKTITLNITVGWKGFITVVFYDERFEKATQSEISEAKILYYQNDQQVATKNQILAGEDLYVNEPSWRGATNIEIKGALFDRNQQGEYVQAEDKIGTKYIFKDGETLKQFRYGSTISANDCPPTTVNFSGWYYDKGTFLRLYNYNTVLNDISVPGGTLKLYARHSVTITYNYGIGAPSTVSLDEVDGGVTVPVPDMSNRIRNGYDFAGWYLDANFTVANQWSDASGNLVQKGLEKGGKTESEITLYAKYVGKNVTLKFYNPNDMVNPVYNCNLAYGSEFGSTLATASQYVTGMQYWKYGLTPIYHHTVLDDNLVQSYVTELTIVAEMPESGDYNISVVVWNDESIEGNPNNDDNNVQIERHPQGTAYSATLILEPEKTYSAYYILGEATWSNIGNGTFYTVFNDDLAHLTKNGSSYLDDSQSGLEIHQFYINNSNVLRVYKDNELKDDSYGVRYKTQSGTYEILNSSTSANFDLDNLYINVGTVQEPDYRKVTVFTVHDDRTIYKYSYANGATALGYSLIGWYKVGGSINGASSSHALWAWASGTTVYRVYSDELNNQGDNLYWDFGNSGKSFTAISSDGDLKYDASWFQTSYTIKISNNAHGYVKAYRSEQDRDNGTNSLGNQFTAYYNEPIYLKFSGENRYKFQSWAYMGNCSITDLTKIDNYNYTATLAVYEDVGIAAIMTLDESIVILNLNYGDSMKNIDQEYTPVVYLVRDGEYIQMKNYDGLDSYIGFASDGNYGVCIYRNGSYYLISDIFIGVDDEGIDHTRNLTVANIELIHMLSQPIHPADNLYDLSSEAFKPVDLDVLSGSYGDDVQATIFVIGGYSFEASNLVNLTFSNPNVGLVNAGDGSITITLSGIRYSDMTDISRTFSSHADKRVVYFIAASDWKYDGDSREFSSAFWTLNVDGSLVTVTNDTQGKHFKVTVAPLESLSGPGSTRNVLTVQILNGMSNNYTVIIMDGTLSIIKAASSSVSVTVVVPTEAEPSDEYIITSVFDSSGPKNIEDMSVDQINQMAMVESRGHVMAVIGSTTGGRE